MEDTITIITKQPISTDMWEMIKIATEILVSKHSQHIPLVLTTNDAYMVLDTTDETEAYEQAIINRMPNMNVFKTLNHTQSNQAYNFSVRAWCLLLGMLTECLHTINEYGDAVLDGDLIRIEFPDEYMNPEHDYCQEAYNSLISVF